MARKTCHGGRVHDDARALVEFVFEHGGQYAAITVKNEEIARRLNWMQNHGHGHYSVDGSRFTRARRHAMDCDGPDGHSCCGYRLNYRKAGRESILGLLDPTGEVAEHAMAAIGSVLGWITRTRQHQSENGRIATQIEALGDHALNRGDRHGYRLCVQGQLEIDEYGFLRPQTLGALYEWIGSLQ